MTHMKRVPINLPTASTGVVETKSPPYQIAIDANGVTTWEGKIVTLSEITARLKAAAVAEDARVLIAADENARHKQVLGVINAVRDAGVEKVSFETKP
jgi:biopolymer transport protein ExbD